MTENGVRFDGRAILVTGAARGIGRAHAMLLAARGAKVVVADNGAAMDGEAPSAAPAQSVVAEIKAAGGEAVACTADIATEAGSTQAVEASLRAFGRIDGILHNASTSPDIAPADKVSSHDLDLVMRVNPFAGFWMTRAAWPHMVRQNHGRIVYMTSARRQCALRRRQVCGHRHDALLRARGGEARHPGQCRRAGRVHADD